MADRHVIEQWDQAAARYSGDQAESPFAQFNLAFVEQLLGDLSGRRALDAGCGDGTYCALLQRLGADVAGLDGSRAMLKLARERCGCELALGDLTAALPYPNAAFDVVLSNQVLMDIAPIEPFAAEAARLLKPGGRLVWSIVHPAFYLGEWRREDATGAFAKLVGGYTREATLQNQFWGQTTHYHRPLGFYLNAFAGAGLRLAEFYEPAIPAVERFREMPLFAFGVHLK